VQQNQQLQQALQQQQQQVLLQEQEVRQNCQDCPLAPCATDTVPVHQLACRPLEIGLDSCNTLVPTLALLILRMLRLCRLPNQMSTRLQLLCRRVHLQLHSPAQLQLLVCLGHSSCLRRCRTPG
jgi:hypothetical protein